MAGLPSEFILFQHMIQHLHQHISKIMSIFILGVGVINLYFSVSPYFTHSNSSLYNSTVVSQIYSVLIFHMNIFGENGIAGQHTKTKVCMH